MRHGKRASIRLDIQVWGQVIAESFRNLRAALSLLGRFKIVVFFSLPARFPTKARTVVLSVNYALALALQGHPRFLLDRWRFTPAKYP